MSDFDSPQPFRRERNRSNRNFAKRDSHRRRQSTESHSSLASISNAADEIDVEAGGMPTPLITANATANGVSTPNTPSTPSMPSMPASPRLTTSEVVARKQKSILKMHSLDGPNDSPLDSAVTASDQDATERPDSPDPANLRFSQKRNLFENIRVDQAFFLKAGRNKSKSTQSLLTSERIQASLMASSPSPSPSPTSASSTSGSYMPNAVPVLPPMDNRQSVGTDSAINRHSSYHTSIDEAKSEDEVESLPNDAAEVEVQSSMAGNQRSNDDFESDSSFDDDPPSGDEFQPGIVAVNQTLCAATLGHSTSFHGDTQSEGNTKTTATGEIEIEVKTAGKDFPRNFRSRPLTAISGSQTVRVRGEVRFHSQYGPNADETADDAGDEQIQMRDKGFACIQPILDELIKTEETYVTNLWKGINNYGNIFERKDLPMGLRGKKYVLFGNVEQIAEFHRDEFLPMLQRNRHDLKRLFDEFQQFVEQNCFYGYVLFTMNKQRSLQLCDSFKNYFKLIQTDLDDRLGINSFLVQPIQRMARYPLLLTQFIQTLFKNRDSVSKPVIESCCRLEKRLRNLLITTNESETINDIVYLREDNEFNSLYQGKFRKVSEFQVNDLTLRRSYRSKVFIFDKCIIYTEIKGKQLVYHGRYPCEHIGIEAKTKSFTLYYEQRKKQECEFTADPLQIEQWLELIREMICSFAEEERKKLKELRSREFSGDHMHRKPANLSLFRDSNRFSSDSGIGNIWVVPKPEHEETVNHRTTWYAIN